MKKLSDSQKLEVKEILADKLGFFLEDIEDKSNLENDLGMDSLDAIELLMEFEKVYNISIPDSLAENVKTVDEVYICIEKCM
jgi:acyl carrier protein